MIKNSLILWILFAVSIFAFWQYLAHREEVFPVKGSKYLVSNSLSPNTLKKALEGIIDPKESLEFSSERYIDRNSLKFLQQTMGDNEFLEATKQNTSLGGWIVHLEKPFPAEIKLSPINGLVGFERKFSNRIPPEFISEKVTLSKLWNITGIDFDPYINQNSVTINNRREIKFRLEVPDTGLMQSVHVVLFHGNLERYETTLLLPVSYAEKMNAQVEKQKTLREIFNLFHYILIAIVFLVMFRSYETKKLSWRRNLPLFLILFFCELIVSIFEIKSTQTHIMTYSRAILKTFAQFGWAYALFVVADFIARLSPNSRHSLSDLISSRFFASEQFRKSLVVGWFLFVIQLVFVGLFYKIFLQFGAYVPLKIPGEHATYQAFEVIKYLCDALTTSMYEEILYRLFMISLFIVVFRKVWIAIAASALLWGFMHFSYQFEPYYIRGLELTLVGLLYGGCMVRYGILSVITAHFLYNGFVMSEYEHFDVLYGMIVLAVLGFLYFVSWFLRNDVKNFEFSTVVVPKLESMDGPIAERRNIARRVYPLSWKYGIGILVALGIILTQVPLNFQNENALSNRNELLRISSRAIPAYDPNLIWGMTYYKENPHSPANHSRFDKDVLQAMEPYQHLWSVRYFSKKNNMVLCDLDFTHNYELLFMNCPYVSNIDLSFQEWVRRIKPPEETWTIFNATPNNQGGAEYQYTVPQEYGSKILKTVFMKFQNNQLVQFKKEIKPIGLTDAEKTTEKKPIDASSIVLSIVLILLFIGYFKFLFSVLREEKFWDKTSFWGSIISCAVYAAWKINSYTQNLIDLDYTLTLKHHLTNEFVYTMIKMLCLAFISYMVFYAFFRFPSRVFKHVPNSKEWISILSRPIWKWRNNRVSLLYAVLLLMVQTLLRMLIQINNGMTNLDLFHFDVGYFNHQYLFVTFAAIAWKNVMFWSALMIVVSILEKYLNRYVYLIGLALIVGVNVFIAKGSLDSKLIELCAIYIVFYFVYNIARFDFAFYFWFILLNSLLTFTPLLFSNEYETYSYQVVFMFILVFTVILYSLFTGRRKLA